MSLNFDKIGASIARIKDNTQYKNKDIISVATDEFDSDTTKTFQSLKLNTGHFQPMPNINSERSCNLVVGASGSGKSRYICEWVKEYKKMYKKNPIYLFSSLEQDESLEPIKPLRMILDNEFLTEDINLKIYANSCFIFDDCDTIQNKKIQDKVYSLMNMMLNTGRHHNITVWVVNHTATGTKSQMKTILNECHTIVYFPANHNRQLTYMLENYCGLDHKQQKVIKQLNSRWVCINKHYPQCCVTNKNIFMLSEINK